MKRVINKKVYNTETAMLIAENFNGLVGNDYRSLTEQLYRTKKENYFLCGSGGPLTKYAKSSGNQTYGSSEIIPMTNQEAYQWLEENKETEAIEEFFPDEFEEA